MSDDRRSVIAVVAYRLRGWGDVLHYRVLRGIGWYQDEEGNTLWGQYVLLGFILGVVTTVMLDAWVF